jgi:hypothetical protein
VNIDARLLAAALLLAAFAPAGGVESDTPEGLIQALYAHHQPGRRREIDTCKKGQISKYCDARLTELLLKDCACSKRKQEVCNLDWDPFYDSQDFGEGDPNPRIKRADPADTFEVTITNLGDTRLTYEMTRTKSGWRISDIRTSKWDLVKVLSGEQK